MNALDQLPLDVLHDLANAIATSARRTDAEDWIVRNLHRYPKRFRAEVIEQLIEHHFDAAHAWQRWAVLEVSVAIEDGRIFQSRLELVGYVHEFLRKLPAGKQATHPSGMEKV